MMVLTRSIACGKRIVEVLEEQPEITDDDAVKEIADDGTERELTLSDGSIRFDHVYFKYHPDSAEWNLTDIDFSIASGMTVGILGGTGSAKSTLVSLIPRLYEATEGAVYVAVTTSRTTPWRRCGSCAMVAAEEHPVLRHHPG